MKNKLTENVIYGLIVVVIFYFFLISAWDAMNQQLDYQTQQAQHAQHQLQVQRLQ